MRQLHLSVILIVMILLASCTDDDMIYAEDQYAIPMLIEYDLLSSEQKKAEQKKDEDSDPELEDPANPINPNDGSGSGNPDGGNEEHEEDPQYESPGNTPWNNIDG